MGPEVIGHFFRAFGGNHCGNNPYLLLSEILMLLLSFPDTMGSTQYNHLLNSCTICTTSYVLLDGTYIPTIYHCFMPVIIWNITIHSSKVWYTSNYQHSGLWWRFRLLPWFGWVPQWPPHWTPKSIGCRSPPLASSRWRCSSWCLTSALTPPALNCSHYWYCRHTDGW